MCTARNSCFDLPIRLLGRPVRHARQPMSAPGNLKFPGITKSSHVMTNHRARTNILTYKSITSYFGTILVKKNRHKSVILTLCGLRTLSVTFVIMFYCFFIYDTTPKQ
jgi:hypothetical protein